MTDTSTGRGSVVVVGGGYGGINAANARRPLRAALRRRTDRRLTAYGSRSRCSSLGGGHAEEARSSAFHPAASTPAS
jgi:hypothetical protein